jgi:galactokinase
VAGAAQSIKRFRELYPSSDNPRVWRAPGRVNLIGEHTDYNLGLVLPMAIELACYVAASPNTEGLLRVYSEQFAYSAEWRVDEIPGAVPKGDWTDRVVGIAWELSRRGVNISPQNVLIDSDVPLGGGLSSSAALGVSLALALGGPRELRELAELARAAEVDFAGMPCGIMDQFVSAHGREGAAILLDCRSLEWKPVMLPDEVAIVTVNSMVKHELGASAYRVRVAECAEAARRLGASSLRDARLDDLRTLQGTLLKRARHVVTENARVEQFVAAAARNDTGEMGRLATESHRSLRDDYEVSAAELDFLVDAAVRVPGVLGARMTGGGFGGSTVNFVRKNSVEPFKATLECEYHKAWRKVPEIHVCVASAGASEVFP